MAPNDRPTESEQEILAVLWRQGQATVREVHEVLAPQRGTGYTSTLKLMQLMVGKGLVRRTLVDGRHVYRPAIAPETARRRILPGLLDRLFAGSTRLLVQHALEEGDVPAEDLAEIRKMLDLHAKRKRRPS